MVKKKNEIFTAKESRYYLVRFPCAGYHWLPNHRQNYPDADQDPQTSCDGYSDQHRDQYAVPYQHGDQHPCADANTEPHRHPTADRHTCPHAYGHARACQYASSASHADPRGTSHRYPCAGALRRF